LTTKKCSSNFLGLHTLFYSVIAQIKFQSNGLAVLVNK
jgi:hypothetical protein